MSKIEWTEKTWNPLAGCSVLSPGCTHCYAMRMAARIEAMGSAPHYAGTTKIVNGKPVWTGKIALAPEHILLEPLKRRVPTTYFVNSMSDLFHEGVPNEVIDRVFAVMALTPQHTYQVLTKRSTRMRAYMPEAWGAALPDGKRWGEVAYWRVSDTARKHWPDLHDRSDIGGCNWWPLPNVWLGVSAERQKEASERIPDLLATPAAVRFVSAEPLLEPLNLAGVRDLETRATEGSYLSETLCAANGGLYTRPGLDWVIVGGESGPGARPFDLDWARLIVAQCRSAGVACFVKQLGSHPVDSARACAPADYPLALRGRNKKGGDPAEWPPELRVREMPVLGEPREVAA